MNAAGWKRPGVQTELRAWSKRLNSVGIPWTPDDLQEKSIAVQAVWSGARKKVVWPFQRYLRLIGAPQGWYMFTGPDREPQRFMLSMTTSSTPATTPTPTAKDEDEDTIVVGDTEDIVFDLGRSLRHPELIHPDFLDDHRVRRALFQSSWGKTDTTFRLICDGFSRHLRERRDDVDDVICRLIGRKVEHPWRREEARPARVTRKLTLHKDGSADEEKDGEAFVPSKKGRTSKKPRELLRPDTATDKDSATDSDANVVGGAADG
jgi:hypothetical protein